MLLQFDLKHIHKVNFYPSDNNFTQALLVLLVTNMISERQQQLKILSNTINHYDEDCHNLELNIHWILDTTQAKATTTKKNNGSQFLESKASHSHFIFTLASYSTLYLSWNLNQHHQTNKYTTDKQDISMEHLVIKSVKNQNMCTKGTKLRASKCFTGIFKFAGSVWWVKAVTNKNYLCLFLSI